ncbi:MAG: adenine phosphoribosyltransferase [Bacteroidetes bacterium]|nr:adenine phosphoribosyltransferase [Bacteroidota bacterium]MBK9670728.1 adenine phosphoribosyltransferase [Bacteroidota bacterium]MBK9799903.1 adenine phosphoribosyltransferase [Bacteroidota bacterium]MBP6414569.1 adenine phosphoribosyltransferase [Bacteroidia bacterium]
MIQDKVKERIRDVKDFPKEGILFKDITPILEDPKLCSEIIHEFVRLLADVKLNAIVGVESRGFLFGMMLANQLGVPFIPVRKKGKLPYKTISYKYDLEYGSAEVEMHIDTIKPNWHVLVHDDLLATGGTAVAAAELIKQQGASVAGFAFLVGLNFLNGNEKLKPYSENIVSLVTY